MKRKFLSHGLKVIMFLFIILAILSATLILPTAVREITTDFPEYLVQMQHILIICQALLGLFILGLIIIIYLLIQFDFNKVYSNNFLKWLKVIVAMCLTACLGLVYLIHYFYSMGGAGFFILFAIIVTILLILTVMGVTLLFSSIISDTIKYKEDVDLTI